MNFQRKYYKTFLTKHLENHRIQTIIDINPLRSGVAFQYLLKTTENLKVF